MVATRGGLLVALGTGLWPPMVLLAEIVQTFVLADFCYYYVKRLVPCLPFSFFFSLLFDVSTFKISVLGNLKDLVLVLQIVLFYS